VKTALTFVRGITLSFAPSAVAREAPKANHLSQIRSAAPALELSARTSDLALHANAVDHLTTTINALKSAVRIPPATSPAIVGAVARSVPDMASAAAGTAAAEQLKQAGTIAKAAARRALAQAGKVAVAICRAVPNLYRGVAIVVSHVVPSANEQMLEGVASVLPVLQPSIDRTMVGVKSMSVSETLMQVTISVAPELAIGAPAARGPAVGPVYVPLTTTPVSVTPGTSGQVPPGGRNYAKP
jgi:hypothetical protein